MKMLLHKLINAAFRLPPLFEQIGCGGASLPFPNDWLSL